MPALDPRFTLRFMVFRFGPGPRGYYVVDQTDKTAIWGPGSKQEALQFASEKNELLGTKQPK